MRHRLATVIILLFVTVLTGCASAPSSTGSALAKPPPASSYASLLTYPDRLQPIGKGEAQRWIDPATDFRAYQAVLVERIRVHLNADSSSVDPADLKVLTDYFQQALVKAAQPGYAVADKPGPGVLRVRVTLVDLVATKPEVSVAVLVTPYATVPDLLAGEAAGGPVGSAPYLGRTGIAAEFIDGGTGRVVAEFVDLQFGRKYVLDSSKGTTSAVDVAAQSYFNAYSTWAYAKQAFDFWASQFRSTLDDLRTRS